MLFVPYVLTVAILGTQLPFVDARAPDTPPPVVTAPKSLEDAIPPCARFCVDGFIKRNYPPVVCTDPTDLNCLCTKNSATGYTLGEAAIRCSASFCLQASPFLPSILINTCTHIPGSLPNTRPSLPITNFPPPLPIPTQTETQTQTQTQAQETTTSATTTTSHPEPSTRTRATSTASETYTNNGGARATTSQPAESTFSVENLSTPEIAGISIAGASAFILGLALLYLCVRRRRKSAAAKGDIPDEGEDNSPKLPRGPDPQCGVDGSNQRIINRETRPAFTDPIPPPLAVTRTPKSSPIPANDIGVAIYPDYLEDSPNSQNSRRTDSQLLPDKPNYSLYPEPLRLPNRENLQRESSTTVFEEDMPENRAYYRPAVAGCSHGVGLPSDPRALMYAMERRNRLYSYGSSSMPTQQPSTTSSMPPGQNYQNFIGMPSMTHDPQPAPHPGSAVQIPTYSNMHFSSQDHGTYQAPREERTPCSHQGHSQFETQRNKTDSIVSNTTFESIDGDSEDEYGHPSRTNGLVTRLSPVQEASTSSGHTGRYSPPQSTNPVSYPKMPRSASVTRQAETLHQPRAAHIMKTTASSSQPQNLSKSPPLPTTQQPQQHQAQSVDLFLCPQHSLSGSNSRSESSTSTLLAKRRGDSVADKMESSLSLSSTSKGKWTVVEKRNNGSKDNDSTMDEACAHKGNPAPPSGSSSPHRDSQEVRLTPTRKGHDLFLNVEKR